MINYLDFLILGIIILFLFIKLRSVLGKKVGYQEKIETRVGKTHNNPLDKTNNENTKLEDISKNKYPVGSLMYILDSISKIDDTFTSAKFKNSAKIVFEKVLTSFASKDTESIKHLVSKDILNALNKQIQSLEEANKKLIFDIKEFLIYEIIDANLTDKVASIDVKFVTHQVKHIADKKDVIDSTTLNHKELSEVWTFEKDLSDVNNKVWALTEVKNK